MNTSSLAIGAPLFLLLFAGIWQIVTGFFPKANPAAERAVLARRGKKENLTITVVNKLSVKLLRFIHLEETDQIKLRQSLSSVRRSESPELFHATAWATGIIYFSGVMLLVPVLMLLVTVLFPGVISPMGILQLGALAAILLFFVGRKAVFSDLEAEIKERKEAIEWELPQFAGTVLQSLGHSRNVMDILESYKKICGPSLLLEIERTLNDMRTGNHEQAIKNMALRINSGAFTQLAQGLIGLLRGDDQTAYFQIITKDFTNGQKEAMKKELLKRPGKLTGNTIFMLLGMLLMLIVAVGGYLMDNNAGLF